MNWHGVFTGRIKHLSAAVVMTGVFMIGFAAGNLHAIGAAQGITAPSPEVEEAFAPLWQTFNLIQSEYIEDVELSTLVDGATAGMVEALDDEFSGYMDPTEYALLNDDLEGEIEGIGVVITTNEDEEIEVVGLLEGSPAQEAGVLPGDIFTKVNGEDVTGMSQLQLAGRVRGAEGTPVTITMRRGEELIEFTIVRRRITIPNVETAILDGNIGYIKLNQFSAGARSELDTALQELDINSRAGLVLDFRNNPGGLWDSAISIASAFVPDGTIVTEAFSETDQRVFNATGNYANVTVPIVVLVNEASASASELVAGAMQDRGVATIIGETTFGKGTVQTWHTLVNGGGVRLTIARWITPSGRWIHDQGIEPDIVVEWTPRSWNDPDDPQLDAAVAHLIALHEDLPQAASAPVSEAVRQ